MRKLLLASIILFFVFTVIPTQRTKAAVDCAAAQIISVTATVAADAVCANGPGEDCNNARAEAFRAQLRFIAACFAN